MRIVKALVAFGLLFTFFAALLPAINAAGPGVQAKTFEGSGQQAFMETAVEKTGKVENPERRGFAAEELVDAKSAQLAGDKTFSERMAVFLTNPFVVPVLLSLAALGLLLELFTPGLGIPGFMGLLSLLLFFYGHFEAGLAGYDSIVLLIIGLGLLVAEFLVPGGIAGILGIAAVIGSILLAGGDPKNTAISILIAMIAATAGMVIIVKFFGKRPHLFKRFILTDATDTKSGYVSTVNRPELVGRLAVTATALRPSGTIKLDDEWIDAVSDGRFIGPKRQVKIIKTEGARIVVRELEKEEEE